MVLPTFSAAFPELFVLIAAALILLFGVFNEQRFKFISYYLVQASLIVAAVLTLMQWNTASVTTFSGLLISDDITRLLKLFVYLTTFVTFNYSKQYITERKMPISEYYVLGLFSVLGMMVLISAHSLLTVYLGLELLSLSLYAMTALRRESTESNEAAMKYFIMGAIASGILLYGLSILYGMAGSLDIGVVTKAMTNLSSQSKWLALLSLVFIVVAIGFKLALAPFHMWAPDVYSGAPSSVTLLLGTAPKLAAFAMLLRLIIFMSSALLTEWQQLLIIMAVLSIVIGNVLAIAQDNIKRMLAYSGIAHMGYMLLGLIAGNDAGYSAALFYMLSYVLMSLAAFGMVVLLSQSGFEAERIEDFKGLHARQPYLAFMMLLVMFSMAGIPPTVGFFAKLLVLKVLVAEQFIGLALFALLLAVIGAFYYLRVIKAMYFDSSDAAPVLIHRSSRVLISINGSALLLLGLFPQMLWQLCRTLF